MGSESRRPDAFTAHASFVRRLARQLVRDEHEREDLLQEVHLAALALGADGASPRGSAGERDPRPWLARVVRNAAANLRRNRNPMTLRYVLR